MAQINKSTLEFLKGLKYNNNREWFLNNQSAYKDAKNNFESFVQDVINGITLFDPIMKGLEVKSCVYRINRDIRFSNDKSPYKRSMAASIGPGGKKSTRLTYYLHIEPPDASMIAGGLHTPDSSQIIKFREAVDRNAKPFKEVINNKVFKQTFGDIQGEKLKTAPKGYDRDHPEIELLRLKEVVAIEHLTDAQVLSPKFGDHVIETFTVMKPFLDYLNSVIG